MPLLDYTTSVPVQKTVAQAQAKLVEHGARAVMMEYDGQGRANALAFKVKTPDGELPIRLPIDAAATFKVLQRQHHNGKIPARYASEEHAYRVAWRIPLAASLVGVIAFRPRRWRREDRHEG